MTDRMSAADYNEHMKASSAAGGRVARGRVKPQGMNKLEQEYAAHLQARLIAGEVQWYSYEALKLRLADNTFLTVDFFVMLANDELEAHETKGFMEDDAAVKLKVAASKFPFRFYLVRKRAKKDGGGFTVEGVGNGC